MRKWLAILGLMLVVAPIGAQKPLPVDGSQQQEHSQNHSDAAHPSAPPACTSDVCKENAENAERYAYYKAHPKEYLETAFAPANLVNWILAGLGAIGGLLAILTLRIIKRQTKAAQVAAEAALRQANHIANTERAWLIPNITQPSDRDVMSLNVREDNWTLPIQVTFTNLGKTPAIGISALMEQSSEKIVKPTNDMAPILILDLKEPPSYEHWNKQGDAFAPGSIYAPGEQIHIYLEIERKFLIEEKEAWESGKKCLCIKGFIEYEDAFDSYITRFCYAYQDIREIRARAIRSRYPGYARRDREFRKARPESYNEIDKAHRSPN